AEYQVAEGDLRLEVANAAPDLTLGPGIFFDQGTGKFTLGLGFPSLSLNRNRGPIREAGARRELAGSRLMQEQERVLEEVDAALAQCQLSAREVTAVDSLTTEAERRHALLAAAWNRGEVGRLEVLVASLEVLRARRLGLESRLRQWDAGAGLERAVGAWGLRQDGDWPRKRTE
ncbi:MAG TPA: TolC family protein, partial [Gemmatimonadales bacterium]|nr:TolC family protein [Gemmatimonadales bacterium]